MSLNERNNLTLWLVVVANVLVLYGCVRWGEWLLSDAEGALRDAKAFVPIGIGGVVATVMNHLIPLNVKSSLVYWRRRNALPGHRAFSEHVNADSRIDAVRLRKRFKGNLPEEPPEQNSEWFKLYDGIRDHVVVKDANRTFLLLRDYSTLSALFIPIFGAAGFLLVERSSVALGYVVGLITQYLVVRTAAANAGVRLVRDVLALKTAKAR